MKRVHIYYLYIKIKCPHGLKHTSSGDISNRGRIFLRSNKALPVNYTSVPRRRELVCKLIYVHTTVSFYQLLVASSTYLRIFLNAFAKGTL